MVVGTLKNNIRIDSCKFTWFTAIVSLFCIVLSNAQISLFCNIYESSILNIFFICLGFIACASFAFCLGFMYARKNIEPKGYVRLGLIFGISALFTSLLTKLIPKLLFAYWYKMDYFNANFVDAFNSGMLFLICLLCFAMAILKKLNLRPIWVLIISIVLFVLARIFVMSNFDFGNNYIAYFASVLLPSSSNRTPFMAWFMFFATGNFLASREDKGLFTFKNICIIIIASLVSIGVIFVIVNSFYSDFVQPYLSDIINGRLVTSFTVSIFIFIFMFLFMAICCLISYYYPDRWYNQDKMSMSSFIIILLFICSLVIQVTLLNLYYSFTTTSTFVTIVTVVACFFSAFIISILIKKTFLYKKLYQLTCSPRIMILVFIVLLVVKFSLFVYLTNDYAQYVEMFKNSSHDKPFLV